MTGVLGEYVWRNLDEARRRPRYIVERVVKPAADAHGPEEKGGVESPQDSPTRRAA